MILKSINPPMVQKTLKTKYPIAARPRMQAGTYSPASAKVQPAENTIL